MRYYPIFLDLSHGEALVVGAGAVGLRKIASLLQTPLARLTVVDPAPSDNGIAPFLPDKRVTVARRAFVREDISGKSLVFAATGNRSVNALVAELCAADGVWCNVADAPDSGNFFVPAHFSRDAITIAVSTGGNSPALARRIREELEAWLGNRYTLLAMVLGRLRPMLLELGLETADNTALLRALINSPLAARLETREFEAAVTLLREHLPESLHPRMGELIHDL